jgi:hypothetical protein
MILFHILTYSFLSEFQFFLNLARLDQTLQEQNDGNEHIYIMLPFFLSRGNETRTTPAAMVMAKVSYPTSPV